MLLKGLPRAQIFGYGCVHTAVAALKSLVR
jgi:hypothetical protein